MASRALRVGLLLLGLLIAGCGTVANLVKQGPEGGRKSPFGGVRQDEVWIQKAARGELGCRADVEPPPEPHPQAALLLLCTADLPFSFVGDLVTWPYTAAYSFINQPVPLPPVIPAPVEGRPQTVLLPEKGEPEKKAPGKGPNLGEHGGDKPAQLPMPAPLPKKLAP